MTTKRPLPIRVVAILTPIRVNKEQSLLQKEGVGYSRRRRG